MLSALFAPYPSCNQQQDQQQHMFEGVHLLCIGLHPNLITADHVTVCMLAPHDQPKQPNMNEQTPVKHNRFFSRDLSETDGSSAHCLYSYGLFVKCTKFTIKTFSMPVDVLCVYRYMSGCCGGALLIGVLRMSIGSDNKPRRQYIFCHSTLLIELQSHAGSAEHGAAPQTRINSTAVRSADVGPM